MKSITDLATARALPEKEYYRIMEEVQPDGSILKRPQFRDLVAVEMSDSAIFLFRDTDGRIMMVNYDTEGAYKTEEALVPEW